MFGFPEAWSRTVLHLSLDNLEVLSPFVQLLSDVASDASVSEPPFKRRKLSEAQTAAAHFLKTNPMHS